MRWWAHLYLLTGWLLDIVIVVLAVLVSSYYFFALLLTVPATVLVTSWFIGD
jgi:hypothetical protein